MKNEQQTTGQLVRFTLVDAGERDSSHYEQWGEDDCGCDDLGIDCVHGPF